MKTKLVTLMTVLTIITVVSCSNDDDSNAMAQWEVEVSQVRAATSKYENIDVAVAEGFIDVSGFVPNMGHHYLLPPRVDGTFELEKPEIVLYAPDDSGDMKFVAVEYAIAVEDVDNPGNPPEGFAGDFDEWHFNETLGQWQLHVWTELENADGIFAAHNNAIGD